MSVLLKEILDEVKCMHKEIIKLQNDVECIKTELGFAKRHMEIVSDHTIKFDSHIDFIENKFNWYKSTLDCLHDIVTLKFIGIGNGGVFSLPRRVENND
jgi:phosphate uptake regulator